MSIGERFPCTRQRQWLEVQEDDEEEETTVREVGVHCVSYRKCGISHKVHFRVTFNDLHPCTFVMPVPCPTGTIMKRVLYLFHSCSHYYYALDGYSCSHICVLVFQAKTPHLSFTHTHVMQGYNDGQDDPGGS